MSTLKSIEQANKEIVLVLGMVYINYNTEYSNYVEPFGQEWRDYQRIISLINNGYNVFSLDDKHKPIIGKHCNANFNNPRRMMRSFKIQKAFPLCLKAKYILLDYFFSPVIYIIYTYYIIIKFILLRRVGHPIAGIVNLFRLH